MDMFTVRRPLLWKSVCLFLIFNVLAYLYYVPSSFGFLRKQFADQNSVRTASFYKYLQKSINRTFPDLDLGSIGKRVVSSNDVQSYINPHPYNFVISEDGVCSNNTGKLLVVIVVCTGLRNFEARAAIRETWGSPPHLTKLSARMVFLVGATSDGKLQQRVVKESSQFHDLIQEDFLDTYRNLSLKSVAMLKWVTSHCLNSKFVLKTDDDMFINVKMIHTTLSIIPPYRTIIGHVIPHDPPHRKKASKWYVSEAEYSGKVYPPFCQGVIYGISTDLVPDLYNTTLFTKSFWLEDVYITGICAQKLNPKFISNRGFTSKKRVSHGCAFQRAISGHMVTPFEMRTIWRTLDSIKCPPY